MGKERGHTGWVWGPNLSGEECEKMPLVLRKKREVKFSGCSG
jgi:hypothetical protein